MAMYKAGEIYRIRLNFGFITYVILVQHIHKGMLGYRSLLAKENEPSISIEVLKKYNHEFVCSKQDKKFSEVLKEMKMEGARHLRMWELMNAEGHNASDIILMSYTAIGN